MHVDLVRFPAEGDRLATLRRNRIPRLLFVEDGVDPPVPVDDREDWIRTPADPRDVQARMVLLARRAAGDHDVEPLLDKDGVLRVGDEWVSLPPLEARLAQILLDRVGAVVSRETLTSRGWPGGAPGRNPLDVHVLRLRRRLAPVGLVIRTVRSRGYVLERARRDFAVGGMAEARR